MIVFLSGLTYNYSTNSLSCHNLGPGLRHPFPPLPASQALHHRHLSQIRPSPITSGALDQLSRAPTWPPQLTHDNKERNLTLAYHPNRHRPSPRLVKLQGKLAILALQNEETTTSIHHGARTTPPSTRLTHHPGQDPISAPKRHIQHWLSRRAPIHARYYIAHPCQPHHRSPRRRTRPTPTTHEALDLSSRTVKQHRYQPHIHATHAT